MIPKVNTQGQIFTLSAIKISFKIVFGKKISLVTSFVM